MAKSQSQRFQIAIQLQHLKSQNASDIATKSPVNLLEIRVASAIIFAAIQIAANSYRWRVELEMASNLGI